MSDVLIPGVDPGGYVAVTQGFAEVAGRWLENLSGEFLAAGLPINSTSNKYENSRIVKSGKTTLFGLSGFSSNAGSQFIQLHDSSTVPSNGAVPVLVISVAATTNFSVAYVLPGRFFARGCVIVNSSTGPTLTIGAADCWFDAQYI
jgi:hypothetical protein